MGTIEEDRLAELLGRFVNDLGATASAGNVLIGDKLGLYQTLADAGPLTPSELAASTATAERYVREWLPGQAAWREISSVSTWSSSALAAAESVGISSPAARRWLSFRLRRSCACARWRSKI